jgi:hypothetical protein
MIGRTLGLLLTLVMIQPFYPILNRWLDQSLAELAPKSSVLAQTPPICPGFEPNQGFDTPFLLTAPANRLDSLRFTAPEQDFVDVWKLPSSGAVTQTLSLVSQGPGSDPMYLLIWFDAGVRRTFMIVDDLDKQRCARGEFWMCTADASFVWEQTERLYAEVYMLGSLSPEPNCRYYRLEYSDVARGVTSTPSPTPTSTATPRPTRTPTPTATATPAVRIFLPAILR